MLKGGAVPRACKGIAGEGELSVSHNVFGRNSYFTLENKAPCAGMSHGHE